MKRSFLLSLILIFLSTLNPVLADTWDDFSEIDKAWDGQKTITNKEFEEVMEALQSEDKKKEEKTQKKKIKKLTGGGKILHSEKSSTDSKQEIPSFKAKEEGILINTPVDIYVNGKCLEKGYYKVLAQKNDKNIVEILFYQSQYLKGKTEAIETEDDYGETTVDFAKIIPYNESYVKLIFGSIDFNAYVFLPYAE